jgi:hypothetical protein
LARYARLAMMPGRSILDIIPAALLAPGGRVGRLAVDARRGPGIAGPPRRADLAAEPVVDPVQRPVAKPLVEVALDGALGREVHGQVTQLASGAEDM